MKVIKIIKTLGIIIGAILIFIAMIIVALLIFFHTCTLKFENKLYTGIEYLNSEKDKGVQYYSFENIGDYENAAFQTYLHSDTFGQGYGSILLVSYDKDEYEAQKEKLINESEWVREKIKKNWPEDEILLRCEIDKWDIYVYSFYCADSEEKMFSWVDDFALVGFDDESCRIAYMKHVDISLDTIGNRSMPTFIMKHFNFDFMK